MAELSNTTGHEKSLDISEVTLSSLIPLKAEEMEEEELASSYLVNNTPGPKRGRGRPRKSAAVEVKVELESECEQSSNAPQKVDIISSNKRRRGRPQRSSSLEAPSTKIKLEPSNKRGPGRPRKSKDVVEVKTETCVAPADIKTGTVCRSGRVSKVKKIFDPDDQGDYGLPVTKHTIVEEEAGKKEEAPLQPEALDQGTEKGVGENEPPASVCSDQPPPAVVKVEETVYENMVCCNID